jgi:hypothetical protein
MAFDQTIPASSLDLWISHGGDLFQGLRADAPNLLFYRIPEAGHWVHDPKLLNMRRRRPLATGVD